MHPHCLRICETHFVVISAPEILNKTVDPHLERVEDGTGVIADVNNNDRPHFVVCEGFLGLPQLCKTNETWHWHWSATTPG